MFVDEFIKGMMASSVPMGIIAILIRNTLKKFSNRMNNVEDKQTALIIGLSSALNGNFTKSYDDALNHARTERDRIDKGLKY